MMLGGAKRPYTKASEVERLRVLVAEGHNMRQIARMMGRSESWVAKWIRELRLRPAPDPKPAEERLRATMKALRP